jgi:hypothetical protein
MTAKVISFEEGLARVVDRRFTEAQIREGVTYDLLVLAKARGVTITDREVLLLLRRIEENGRLSAEDLGRLVS